MRTLIILSICLLFFSCVKNSSVLFCEGVSKEGAGVQCGEKFYAGELTAVIRVDGRFETDSIILEIIRTGGREAHKVDTVNVSVDPESSIANTSLSLYSEGKYRVRVIKNGNELTKSEITIVE